MFEDLVGKILRREKAAGRIDVTLVSEAKIQELNRKYRKKDKPTDVLSFDYLPAGRQGGEGEILGDVVITRKDRRLVIHGVLHILGYDHGREMRHAEEIYQKF